MRYRVWGDWGHLLGSYPDARHLRNTRSGKIHQTAATTGGLCVEAVTMCGAAVVFDSLGWEWEVVEDVVTCKTCMKAHA